MKTGRCGPVCESGFARVGVFSVFSTLQRRVFLAANSKKGGIDFDKQMK